MEYPGDAFHTFLDLDSVIYLAVNGKVTSLPVFIQNILNCVLKTNEAFMGLVSDKWQDFHFGVEYPFNTFYEGMIYVSHEALEIKHLFQEQLYKIIYLKYTANYYNIYY